MPLFPAGAVQVYYREPVPDTVAISFHDWLILEEIVKSTVIFTLLYKDEICIYTDLFPLFVLFLPFLTQQHSLPVLPSCSRFFFLCLVSLLFPISIGCKHYLTYTYLPYLH